MAWHYLKENASNALPRRMIFFNAAKRELQHPDGERWRRAEFLCLHAVSGRWEHERLTRQQRLDCVIPELFWQWVFRQCDPRHTVWLVGHNVLTDLTLTGLWPLIEDSTVILDMPRTKRRPGDTDPDNPHGCGFVCINDPPVIIGLRHSRTGGRFVILDILNYHAHSIATLGASAGLPAMSFPSECAESDSFITYCQRNADIIGSTFMSLLRFVRNEDLGMFRYTAASQSMSAFRHRLMRHKIALHDNMEVKQLERESFYGGQTCVYRHGIHKDTLHQYDVCSLYPYVMRDSYYPIRLKQWNLNPAMRDCPPSIVMSNSIAMVELEAKNETFPLRFNGQTAYRSGRYTTILCGPELEYAYRRGYVARFGRFAEYYCESIFSLFVDSLWQLRLSFRMEGRRVEESIVKLLLNSLYGKFAQKSTEWVNLPDRIPLEPFSQWVEIDTATGTRTNYRAIGWLTQVQVDREETQRSFPAISAFVTAYGRQHMRKLRAIVGQDNVYYQGVDSLIVNDEGRDKLERSGNVSTFAIGKLRHLITANYCDLRCPANYTIGSRVVVAGMKEDSTITGDGEWIEEQTCGIKRLFAGGAVSFVDSEIVSKQFREWFDHANSDQKPDGVDGPTLEATGVPFTV